MIGVPRGHGRLFALGVLLAVSQLALAAPPYCYEVPDPPPACGWADVYPPTAPTSFTAVANSGSQINLSWTASYDSWGVTGYALERCQGAACSNFSQIATPTGTGYADAGLASGTTYRYRLRARDAAANWSDYSSVAAATTPDTQPPASPSGLSANAVSGTQINLSWPAASDNVGVSGYAIESCQGASCSNFGQIGTSASTGFSITGLAVATTYMFRVRAYDAVPNYSGYSTVATAATWDTSPPTAPSGLSASVAAPTQVNLTWSAASDNVGVTGYAVERCLGAGCTSFSQIGTSATTSYSSTGLATDSTYRFRVRAYDAFPNYGGYSAIVAATTPDTQPPSAPTLTATVISRSRIDLSWLASTDNIGVAEYFLERCTGAACSNFSQIVATSGTTHSDSGLSDVTTYRYRVRARDAVPNYGAYSSVVSATTPDGQAPTAPTGLSVTAGPNQLVVTWTASTDDVGVIAYLVERCQGTGCSNYAEVASVTTTSYTDTNVSVANSYSYRVRARDAALNYSGYSSVGTALPATCD